MKNFVPFSLTNDSNSNLKIGPNNCDLYADKDSVGRNRDSGGVSIRPKAGRLKMLQNRSADVLTLLSAIGQMLHL